MAETSRFTGIGRLKSMRSLRACCRMKLLERRCGSSVPDEQRSCCHTLTRARPTSALRLQYRRDHLFETFFVGMKLVLP